MDGEDIDSQLAYHRRLTGGYEVDGLKIVAQLSAYPEVLVDICRQMAEGDKAKAEELFTRCLPLMLFEFQEGIGVGIRKYALQSRGFIENSKVRHPGPNPTDETKEEFLRLVESTGLTTL